MEVLQELMSRQPPPRVLVLTAYQSVELAQRVTRYGAIDYVPKPFDRATLLQAVQRALSLPAWQRSSPSVSSR
jgi:DNA-binding NtrC family response regulator